MSLVRRARWSVVLALLCVGGFAPPAPAARIPHIPSLSIAMLDNYYAPQVVSGVVGLNDAEWHNDGFVFHDVRLDKAPRWFTLSLDEGQSGGVPLRYAGTYAYTCTYHEEMRGTMRVKPRAMQTSGPRGTTFDIGLASIDPAGDGYAFDVQRRRNGARWGSPVAVTTAVYGFRPSKAGKYDVRARLTDTGTTEAGAWSPSVRIRVS